MYMYISPPVVTYNGTSASDPAQSIGILGKELSIYMFLKADGAVLFNKTVKSHIARRNIRLDAIQKYTIDFEAPVSIIPKSIVTEYDPVTQMLIMRSKDSKQTYARMFKKPEISFYCTSEVSRATSSKKISADIDDDENSGDLDDPNGGGDDGETEDVDHGDVDVDE